MQTLPVQTRLPEEQPRRHARVDNPAGLSAAEAEAIYVRK